MKTPEILLLAALLAATPRVAMAQAATAPALPAPDATAAPAAATIATALLDRLDAGDYAAAEALLTAQMAAAVPAERLQAVWESLPAQAGPAQGRGKVQASAADGATLVTVPLHYANAELIAKIAVTADGKVAGFRVQPAQAAASAPVAPVPADAGFSEREIAIGDGERALPATLALPDGDGPFPAVVLVHGSGPHDRNETVGPNRPFLDIARGLAAQGIAVLRYDKRSKVRPQDYADGKLTIDSETTDDAVLAVQALHAVPEVDDARVFVLGHSQGGMLAPRIAAYAFEAGAPVAGLVLFAAPARKLLDIIVEQNRRLAVLDDAHTSDEEHAAIDVLRAQVRDIRGGGEVAATPLNLPAGYWRSTDAVDAVTEAQAVALPMLVLQGAQDIQVVDADWQRWKGAFHADPAVAFKLYDGLNHLGIAVDGEPGLGQYAVPGHVDPRLVADVAAWIGAH
ncbi:DUF3887 domain-containing protein [Cognatiluteimonas weifangensis]|nr:DUF3887 domain-containing protein [Luteimonas weifangensis]